VRARRRLGVVALSLSLPACSGAPQASLTAPPPRPEAPIVASAATPPTLPSAPVATASAPPPKPIAPAPAPAPALDPGPAFPPPSFEAPEAKTAKPGDGVWTALVADAAGKPPLLVRTMVHPDPSDHSMYAAIVAIDRRRVDLRFLAGTEEPKSTTVPREHRPGVIPEADHPDLLAVFNGGFMAKHGAWGMRIGADTFLPPKDEACTVAFVNDGSLRIRTWTTLAPALSTLTAYRQTPPCLLEQGTINPVLEADPRTRRWGSSETGETTIRRSALGLDATGKTLFYSLGEWITPRGLAAAMRAAGAVDVAELDVNWSYTRFLLYGPAKPGEAPEVSETLVPKIKHPTKGYVVKPSDRDFFYLVRRR
jgi:hypothetical protein